MLGATSHHVPALLLTLNEAADSRECPLSPCWEGAGMSGSDDCLSIVDVLWPRNSLPVTLKFSCIKAAEESGELPQEEVMQRGAHACTCS